MSWFRRKKPRKKQAPGPSWRDSCPDLALEMGDLIDSVQPFTMTSPERIAAACKAIQYVCQNQIHGDIVECGVWRGGSMMAMAKTLSNQSSVDRTLWLYDTFEGMSAPTNDDVDFVGRSADTMLASEEREDAESIWCFSALDEVKKNLQSTGYPETHIRYVVGKVEETIPRSIPDRIAILRLDTDWYESTRHELEQLYPRLVPGGVLIVDDYGHWEGCRKAVDEYFQAIGCPILLNRIDYTGRMAIKPPDSWTVPGSSTARAA